MGHDRAPTGLWDENLLTGEPLTRCPVRLLQLSSRDTKREIERWKDQYIDYKKGQLLVSGGIAEQPARWLEAMHYLEEMEQRQESKYIELKRQSEGDES